MILFAIPKGTPAAVCKAVECRKVIWWIKTASGKSLPLNADVEEGRRPTRMLPGQGAPHWIDCVASQQFRKKKESVNGS